MNYAMYAVAALLALGNVLGYIAAPWWLVITIFISPVVFSMLTVMMIFWAAGRLMR